MTIGQSLPKSVNKTPFCFTIQQATADTDRSADLLIRRRRRFFGNFKKKFRNDFEGAHKR